MKRSKMQQETENNSLSLFGPGPKRKRITAHQYNKELEASIKQAREGKISSHEALLKEMENW
jgi:hypothetical protein